MCTHNKPVSMYKSKILLNDTKSAAMGFFPTQERVRNIRGKRAVNVRAHEGILSMLLF